MAQHLAERHDVRLFSFSSGYPMVLFPGRTDRDPSLVHPGPPAQRTLAPLAPWTWLSTARQIAAEAPDLFVVQWWVPFWGPSFGSVMRLVRATSGARVLAVCHNILPHEGPRPFETALTRWALSPAHGYLVHSQADEVRLRALGVDGSIERAVLPFHSIAGGGTDPGDTVSAAAASAGARAAMGVAADARVILFFGFVRPYKGVEGLLAALPRVIEAEPRAHLIIAGEFWQPQDVLLGPLRAAGLADRVTVMDRYIPNEEVPGIFAAADVVVLPYVEASQSGVVTLAVEAGLPIVATRIGGLPDVVEHGTTGLLVPPRDEAALAAALADVLTRPELAEQLRAGVSRARDRFGWDVLIRRVEGMTEAL
jgi:glycosyltransferase involved in cell wall biosynthesis